MSRSYKKVAGHYHLVGARPSLAKKKTSRKIRGNVRLNLRSNGVDFNYWHPLDVKRGHKGNKSNDAFMNKYFGDGYTLLSSDDSDHAKYRRK